MRLLHGPFVRRTVKRFGPDESTVLELPGGDEYEISKIGGPDCPCGLCEERDDPAGKAGYVWSRVPDGQRKAVRPGDPLYMVNPSGAHLNGDTS